MLVSPLASAFLILRTPALTFNPQRSASRTTSIPDLSTMGIFGDLIGRCECYIVGGHYSTILIGYCKRTLLNVRNLVQKSTAVLVCIPDSMRAAAALRVS